MVAFMYVSNIQVALIFELDDKIIFTLGEKLKLAQKDYNANVQILNVPYGAPPEAPRILFLSPTLNINISLNRADIFITLPNQIKSNISSCLNYSYTSVISIYNLLLKGLIKYNWYGIILNLSYPVNTQSSLKAIEKIAPYIVKIDSNNREMASFNLQIGFKEPPYYKNVSVSGYDQYQFEFPSQQEQPTQQINLQDAKISETGINIILDINNIPQSEKNTFEKDFSNMVKKVEDSCFSLLNELNLSGVLNG